MKALISTPTGVAVSSNLPRPIILNPTDAIVRVTHTTICGSDLHIFHHALPYLRTGDILAFSATPSNSGLTEQFKIGDSVVISAVVACGSCRHCIAEEFSLCQVTNRLGASLTKQHGIELGGVFGHSRVGGGYGGCQAEFVRVPFASVNLLKIPNVDPDYLFLSDVLCTSYQAVDIGNVQAGSNVAVWGCGPIGLSIVKWCIEKKANVVAIDHIPYRLAVAKSLGAIPLDYSTVKNIPMAIISIFPAGCDVAIDAVGFRYRKSWWHYLLNLFSMETDSSEALSEAIRSVRKGGIVVPIGDYFGSTMDFPVGAMMEKSVTVKGGQVNVQKYWRKILAEMQRGMKFGFLKTHIADFDHILDAYSLFDKKADGVLKVVIKVPN